MIKNTAQQIENRRDGTEWVVSPPDEVHPTLSGDVIIPLTKTLYAPTPEEIRGMLFELRRQQKWSQGFTAAVLGVTEGAIVKWESGARKPNGAAAKLIFLLHSLVVDKSGKVKNCWDLAWWGTQPCRNSIPLLKLCGTYWVPEKLIDEICATPTERLRDELRRLLELSETPTYGSELPKSE